MYRTRITAKLLVGVAVTAVAGCVSVDPQADSPPRPGSGGTVQDVAPQIVRPPVRDSLGALPDPVLSATASVPSPGARPDAPRAPRQAEPTGLPAQPDPRAVPRIPPGIVPNEPGRPATGKEVCALGRRYGQWPADSPQSRICDAFGR